MGFRKGAYAKVWRDPERKEKYSKINISCSQKNKNGQYETTFSGFVMLLGEAHAKAESLHAGDRIQIGDIDVTNRYDKEKKITYTNFTMYDFTLSGGASPAQKGEGGARKASAPNENHSDSFDGISDDEPF